MRLGKEQMINEINEFINQFPTLNPDGTHLYRNSGKIRNYAKQKGLLIVDYFYFLRKIYDFRDGHNTYEFAIMYNPETKRKNVFLVRGVNCLVNEMSLKLGDYTVECLYKMLVTDIGDHKILLRERKELISDFKNIMDSKKIFVESNDNFLTNFTFLFFAEYNIVDHPLLITYQQRRIQMDFINDNIKSDLYNEAYTINRVSGIKNFLDKHTIAFDTLDEAYSYMTKKYNDFVDSKINSLNTLKNKVFNGMERLTQV